MNIQMTTFGNQRRSLAQADVTSQISKITELQQQGQALMPPAPTQQDLTNMVNQQAATLQQAQDTARNLWWSLNWPYLAVGAGALGVMGYLIFKKK